MNKRRLLKLADLLEADAKNKKGIKFDLALWGTVSDDKDVTSCGTRACAMGLAALSGAFKRAGLKARLSSAGKDEKGVEHFTVNFSWDDLPIDGIRAARNLFGISYAEGCWLFTNHGYTEDEYEPIKLTGASGEKQVAKRLRAFAAGKEAPSPGWLSDHGYTQPMYLERPNA